MPSRGGRELLPSRSNCKGPLGQPCAVTPLRDLAAFGQWANVTPPALTFNERTLFLLSVCA